MEKTRFLQENQTYQGNISSQDEHKQGQKWYGPNRSRRYKNRWQEYTEELNKKDLHDTDNLEGVITPRARHPGMQSQVTLGSITRNKASGGDGIPVELFKILMDDAVKVLPSICQQIWKTQQWPQDWKRSVFIPILKKGSAKGSAQTTTQLHSSCMLAK